MELAVAYGGGPIPYGLRHMIHFACHNQYREGRHPLADNFHCPPPPDLLTGAHVHACLLQTLESHGSEFLSFVMNGMDALLHAVISCRGSRGPQT